MSNRSKIVQQDSKPRREALLDKVLNESVINQEVIYGKRSELHIALSRAIDGIFFCYKNNESKYAESNIKMAIELFQELYPGTTTSDFSKFIVLRKVSKKMAEQILEDADSQKEIADILIYNLDMLK